MTTPLYYLTLVTAFTGLLWLPYVLDRMARNGASKATGYDAAPKAQAPWAQRLVRAHANAVENLVVFAALVLAASAAGVSGPAIANACIVYFWARVVHAMAFAFAIPWLRTLAFFAGFLAQATIAWRLLA